MRRRISARNQMENISKKSDGEYRQTRWTFRKCIFQQSRCSSCHACTIRHALYSCTPPPPTHTHAQADIPNSPTRVQQFSTNRRFLKDTILYKIQTNIKTAGYNCQLKLDCLKWKHYVSTDWNKSKLLVLFSPRHFQQTIVVYKINITYHLLILTRRETIKNCWKI